MDESEAPKALQASECSELLDRMRASCWIFAQYSPGEVEYCPALMLRHGQRVIDLFSRSNTATNNMQHEMSKSRQTCRVHMRHRVNI